MTCPLCEEFRKKYPLVLDEDWAGKPEWIHILDYEEDGSPGSTSGAIECAFEKSEEFSIDNWCCETMKFIRWVFQNDKISPHWHEDSHLGVIPIPRSEDEGIQQGFLVLAWYKNRGRTGQAMVFRDTDKPTILTLKTALFIINAMGLKDEDKSLSERD